MSVAPSPSSSRGEIILQPAYFTSSAFVHDARQDVDTLLQQYSQHYTHSNSRPFALFKQVWQAQGWSPWIHFKVFDARSRAAFLSVMLRLFSERIGRGETPLNRAAALFGLYTIFRTQPSTSAPPLYSAARIQVTCDLYEEIMTLPDALDGEFLLPVRPHVIYVQSELLQAHVFQILPHAEMHPLGPRALPREVVVEDGEVVRKRGRPSKREKMQKARASLAALDGWCADVVGSEVSETRGVYVAARTALEGDEGWRVASGAVAARMDTIRCND